jgi:hypothetical protein
MPGRPPPPLTWRNTDSSMQEQASIMTLGETSNVTEGFGVQSTPPEPEPGYMLEFHLGLGMLMVHQAAMARMWRP